jgi:hypothetical protein
MAIAPTRGHWTPVDGNEYELVVQITLFEAII